MLRSKIKSLLIFSGSITTENWKFCTKYAMLDFHLTSSHFHHFCSVNETNTCHEWLAPNDMLPEEFLVRIVHLYSFQLILFIEFNQRTGENTCGYVVYAVCSD
jgi:hypothetical protein